MFAALLLACPKRVLGAQAPPSPGELIKIPSPYFIASDSSRVFGNSSKPFDESLPLTLPLDLPTTSNLGTGSSLDKRQSCGSIGLGICPSGVCCPFDGGCCNPGHCCTSDTWCYSTFCCRRSEGGCLNVSCCPLKESCCWSKSYMLAVEWVVVLTTITSDGGCCPSG